MNENDYSDKPEYCTHECENCPGCENPEFSGSGEEKKEEGSHIALGIGVGLAVGAGLGCALGNIGMWLPIGMCLGLCIGAGADKKEKGDRK